jgi:hypothetical protein
MAAEQAWYGNVKFKRLFHQTSDCDYYYHEYLTAAMSRGLKQLNPVRDIQLFINFVANYVDSISAVGPSGYGVRLRVKTAEMWCAIEIQLDKFNLDLFDAGNVCSTFVYQLTSPGLPTVYLHGYFNIEIQSNSVQDLHFL